MLVFSKFNIWWLSEILYILFNCSTAKYKSHYSLLYRCHLILEDIELYNMSSVSQHNYLYENIIMTIYIYIDISDLKCWIDSSFFCTSGNVSSASSFLSSAKSKNFFSLLQRLLQIKIIWVFSYMGAMFSTIFCPFRKKVENCISNVKFFNLY